MNPHESHDAGQDPDRTLLVPRPGRRPPQPAAVPAPASTYTSAPVAPASRPLPPAPPGVGLNPLARAAAALLELVVPLRTLATAPDLASLRAQLTDAVRRFESDARDARIDAETIAAARYALCTLVDETISSTPWGGGVWGRRSLLVEFHNEAWGGEKFFLVLQRLSADPRRHLDVLELMYLCLALGLEGRYRVLERGHDQLALLRERLLALIGQQRGQREHDLSPHWRGHERAQPRMLIWPPWVMAVCAGVVLLLLQLTYGALLNRASDPVYARMAALRAAPPARVVAAPVPAAGPTPLAAALALEIDAGLVAVSGNAERAVLTLRGDGGFASGSDEVSKRLLPVLERIGDVLRTQPGRVVVIGHTDDTRPSLSARLPSNFDLSKARARTVAALLAARAGRAERFSSEGRADTEPVAPNDGPANRARNRRVDIVVMAPTASTSPRQPAGLN
ncbi:type IVB secretion system protein IcmH/DotU [Massilia oculi]|uniref:type IVB secretion system protein IcmH/DotU n=1 Tax=Massilia oculi TaxID=945844 RepID=UPI0028B1976F|nr:type IVB secretion system protein IcmH/DotU [Massilia oculi]